MTILAPSRQFTEDGPSPFSLRALASPREFSFTCDDAWHRLVKVKSGAILVATYDYDGQNWRITQTTLGPTVRHYYYTSAWQVIEERVGSSGVSDRLFLWGLLGVDNVILSHRSGTQYYALSNPDAQVRTLVNASGTVLEHYDYHAFGFVRFITPAYGLVGGTGLASAYDWEILYGGYRRDKDTGFYQVRNRYYHPNLGRWLTRDPVGYAGGLNLYAYVGNNPVNGVDPMGLADAKENKRSECGSFIVRDAPGLPVSDPSQQGTAGGNTINGFEVQYIPCDPCSCPTGKIRLVQATSHAGGGPHFDVESEMQTNHFLGQYPGYPPYSGVGGKHGRLSYSDAPFIPYSRGKVNLEVCAVCKNDSDEILGCASFTFNLQTRGFDFPGSKPRDKKDGYEGKATPPGQLWKDAKKQWDEAAKPDSK